MRLPQFEEPSTLGTPPLRDAVVTLPQGLTVDPSSANGLAACSESQIGFTGFDEATETDEFTPRSRRVRKRRRSAPSNWQRRCCLASCTAPSTSPPRTRTRSGACSPGYIVVDDPTTGIVVKIAGELKANETTGQITGVFKNNPQFPFSRAQAEIQGRPPRRARDPRSVRHLHHDQPADAVVRARHRPRRRTVQTASRSSSGCVSGFTPAFSAGTVSNQAGGFSPFTLSLSRAGRRTGIWAA